METVGDSFLLLLSFFLANVAGLLAGYFYTYVTQWFDLVYLSSIGPAGTRYNNHKQILFGETCRVAKASKNMSYCIGICILIVHVQLYILTFE